jgi:hypothetical protein
VSFELFVMMLITPFMAFAPHTVPPRAANHIDALNVFERYIQRIPKHSGENRMINTSAVDQDQHFIGIHGTESAYADGPVTVIDSRDIHAWDHAQQIRNIGGAGTADVFLGDDVNGGTGGRNLLLPFGDGCDLYVHQIFQIELCQVARSGSLSRARARDYEAEHQGTTETRQGARSAIPARAIGRRTRHMTLIDTLRAGHQTEVAENSTRRDGPRPRR